MIKMERIGDVIKLLNHIGECNLPKRMEFVLSENKQFYETKIFIDVCDKRTGEILESYIEVKSKVPSFANDFEIIFDKNDDDAEIFSLIIPED